MKFFDSKRLHLCFRSFSFLTICYDINFYIVNMFSRNLLRTKVTSYTLICYSFVHVRTYTHYLFGVDKQEDTNDRLPNLKPFLLEIIALYSIFFYTYSTNSTVQHCF